VYREPPKSYPKKQRNTIHYPQTTNNKPPATCQEPRGRLAAHHNNVTTTDQPQTKSAATLPASHRELEGMQEGRTRLYLVRHGELTTSQDWRYVGHLDVALNSTGIAQIQRLGRYLQQEPIDLIFSSDLQRTVHSAGLIGDLLGRVPVAEHAFRELHLGGWEGMTRDEILQRFPREFDERSRDIARYRIPGGESFADLQHRVIARLTTLCEEHRGKNILLVAHGGVNRVIICHVLGLALEHLVRIDQAYACLNIIDFFDGAPVLRLLNQTV
jgi:alpha-ribazole phosphatase